ncbi:MAG: hypothetical protein ACK4TP_07460, partial [Hyphomicrobium sp.]
YFSLHCFIVSAFAGSMKQNADRAVTPASIPCAHFDIASSLDKQRLLLAGISLITGAATQSTKAARETLSLANAAPTFCIACDDHSFAMRAADNNTRPAALLPLSL